MRKIRRSKFSINKWRIKLKSIRDTLLDIFLLIKWKIMKFSGRLIDFLELFDIWMSTNIISKNRSCKSNYDNNSNYESNNDKFSNKSNNNESSNNDRNVDVNIRKKFMYLEIHIYYH